MQMHKGSNADCLQMLLITDEVTGRLRRGQGVPGVTGWWLVTDFSHRPDEILITLIGISSLFSISSAYNFYKCDF